ncbi:hypothetical protein CIK06_27535 [Plantactinospora sp. KBS50]|nr:hypothetical protein CIK06_27535 [Plantactinospora sp. KBS50]
MRRRCVRLVDGLGLPRHPDVAQVCAAVGARTDRPVRLTRLEMPPDLPSGVVVVTPSTLGIFVDALAEPWLQDGIACHELAHLLLGHHLRPLDDPEMTRRVLPTIEPWAARQALGAPEPRTLARTCYDGSMEREAEMLGTELFGRLSPWPAEQTWDVPARSARVITRIERALGDNG